MRLYIQPDITLRPLRSDPFFNDIKFFLRFEADQSASSWKYETEAATIDKFRIVNQTQFPLDMSAVLNFQQNCIITCDC